MQTKSPTTPISSNTVNHMTRSITPIALHTSATDYHQEDDLPSKYPYDESANT